MTSLNSAGSGVATTFVHSSRIRSSSDEIPPVDVPSDRNVSKNHTLRIFVRYSTQCRGPESVSNVPGCYLPAAVGTLSGYTPRKQGKSNPSARLGAKQGGSFVICSRCPEASSLYTLRFMNQNRGSRACGQWFCVEDYSEARA
jgi:hypothetical protein